jgi:hypothetical protein
MIEPDASTKGGCQSDNLDGAAALRICWRLTGEPEIPNRDKKSQRRTFLHWQYPGKPRQLAAKQKRATPAASTFNVSPQLLREGYEQRITFWRTVDQGTF